MILQDVWGAAMPYENLSFLGEIPFSEQFQFFMQDIMLKNEVKEPEVKLSYTISDYSKMFLNVLNHEVKVFLAVMVPTWTRRPTHALFSSRTSMCKTFLLVVILRLNSQAYLFMINYVFRIQTCMHNLVTSHRCHVRSCITKHYRQTTLTPDWYFPFLCCHAHDTILAL